jgi:hypothetical protein
MTWNVRRSKIPLEDLRGRKKKEEVTSHGTLTYNHQCLSHHPSLIAHRSSPHRKGVRLMYRLIAYVITPILLLFLLLYLYPYTIVFLHIFTFLPLPNPRHSTTHHQQKKLQRRWSSHELHFPPPPAKQHETLFILFLKSIKLPKDHAVLLHVERSILKALEILRRTDREWIARKQHGKLQKAYR